MSLFQSRSSKLGAIVTRHVSIGLFGWTARYLQARLASAGDWNVTKAVDVDAKVSSALPRFSIIKEVKRLTFVV